MFIIPFHCRWDISTESEIAIATQGSEDMKEWVTKYKLHHSQDGVNFDSYKEPGEAIDKVRYVLDLRASFSQAYPSFYKIKRNEVFL